MTSAKGQCSFFKNKIINLNTNINDSVDYEKAVGVLGQVLTPLAAACPWPCPGWWLGCRCSSWAVPQSHNTNRLVPKSFLRLKHQFKILERMNRSLDRVPQFQSHESG